MERVHYRRYAPSRLNSYATAGSHPAYYTPAEPESDGSFKEKLIMQGIISGIILTVVLALNLVNFPQAARIRESLSQALRGTVSMEQIAQEANRIFNFGEDGAIVIDGFLPQAPTEQAPEYTVPRIDEDVLRELAGYDDLKSQTPAPITLPEF